jgi:acyl-CoA reductase-like NAD-dependent aldehyde dehydrogenase
MAIATKDYGLFIGGETVEAEETRELQEPATGAALGRAAMASPADVDRAVEAARAAL